MKSKVILIAGATLMMLTLIACGPPPKPPTAPASTRLVAGDTVALGQFPVGVSVNRWLSVPGGGSLAVTGGELPEGLSLGTNGRLTGTPTTSTLFFIEVNDNYEAWGGVTTDDPAPLTDVFTYVPTSAPPKDVLLQTTSIGPFPGGISGQLVHEADGDVRPARFVDIGFGPLPFESASGSGVGAGVLPVPTTSPCDIGLIDLTHGNPSGFSGSLQGLSIDSQACDTVTSEDGSTLIVFEMGAAETDWTVHFYAIGDVVPDSSVEVSGVKSGASVARDGSNVVLTTDDPTYSANSLVVVDRSANSATTVPATDGGNPAYVELIGGQARFDVHDGDSVGVALSRSADSSLWLAKANTSTGAVDAVLNMFDETTTISGGFVSGSSVPVTQQAPDGSRTIGILDLSTESVTTLGNWTDNFFNFGRFLG